MLLQELLLFHWNNPYQLKMLPTERPNTAGRVATFPPPYAHPNIMLPPLPLHFSWPHASSPLSPTATTWWMRAAPLPWETMERDASGASKSFFPVPSLAASSPTHQLRRVIVDDIFKCCICTGLTSSQGGWVAGSRQLGAHWAHANPGAHPLVAARDWAERLRPAHLPSRVSSVWEGACCSLTKPARLAPACSII
jgi:hypothetical protein